MCGLCKGLLDDPYMLPCSGDERHIFCRSCLHERWSKKCPVCAEDFSGRRDDVRQPERKLRRIVDQLPISCPFAGCKTILPVVGMREHVGVCEFNVETPSPILLGCAEQLRGSGDSFMQAALVLQLLMNESVPRHEAVRQFLASDAILGIMIQNMPVSFPLISMMMMSNDGKLVRVLTKRLSRAIFEFHKARPDIFLCFEILHKFSEHTEEGAERLEFLGSTLQPATMNVLGVIPKYDFAGKGAGEWKHFMVPLANFRDWCKEGRDSSILLGEILPVMCLYMSDEKEWLLIFLDLAGIWVKDASVAPASRHLVCSQLLEVLYFNKERDVRLRCLQTCQNVAESINEVIAPKRWDQFVQALFDCDESDADIVENLLMLLAKTKKVGGSFACGSVDSYTSFLKSILKAIKVHHGVIKIQVCGFKVLYQVLICRGVCTLIAPELSKYVRSLINMKTVNEVDRCAYYERFEYVADAYCSLGVCLLPKDCHNDPLPDLDTDFFNASIELLREVSSEHMKWTRGILTYLANTESPTLWRAVDSKKVIEILGRVVDVFVKGDDPEDHVFRTVLLVLSRILSSHASSPPLSLLYKMAGAIDFKTICKAYMKIDLVATQPCNYWAIYKLCKRVEGFKDTLPPKFIEFLYDRCKKTEDFGNPWVSTLLTLCTHSDRCVMLLDMKELISTVAGIMYDGRLKLERLNWKDVNCRMQRDAILFLEYVSRDKRHVSHIISLKRPIDSVVKALSLFYPPGLNGREDCRVIETATRFLKTVFQADCDTGRQMAQMGLVQMLETMCKSSELAPFTRDLYNMLESYKHVSWRKLPNEGEKAK